MKKRILCVMFAVALLVSAIPFAAYAEENRTDSSDIEFDFSYDDEELNRGDNATLPTDETIDIEYNTEDEEFSNGDSDASAPSDDETTDIEYNTEDEEFSNGDTEEIKTSDDKDVTIEFETDIEEVSDSTNEEAAAETKNDVIETVNTVSEAGEVSYNFVSTQSVQTVYESSENADDSSEKLGKIVFTSAKATVKDDKKTVKLSWKKVDDATGYKVYRTYTDENGKKITKVFKTKRLTFKNTTNANGKYTYKVRAYKTVDGKNVYGAYSKVV